MAKRSNLKGVKKHRRAGHRPKKNKKSVKQRRKDRLLNRYFHQQQKRKGCSVHPPN